MFLRASRWFLGPNNSHESGSRVRERFFEKSPLAPFGRVAEGESGTGCTVAVKGSLTEIQENGSVYEMAVNLVSAFICVVLIGGL